MFRTLFGILMLAVMATNDAASAIAQSFPNSITAREMYDTCRRGDIVQDQDVSVGCIYYFEGVMSGVLLGSGMLGRDQGLLSGTDIGVIYQNAAELAYGCSNTDVALGQRIRVFMRWVQENPAQEHIQATIAFAISNSEAWPCE